MYFTVTFFFPRSLQILFLQTHFLHFLGTQLDCISQPSLKLIIWDHASESLGSGIWAGVTYILSGEPIKSP